MKTPKVTIIVPIYGVEKFIERCARSLFEQSLDEIEYIFVDDCSKDASVKILEEVLSQYPKRAAQTRIIHHQSNEGLAAARNTGLLYSHGEYIMHCDSDDWLEKSASEEVYFFAIKNNLDVVLIGSIWEYKQKKVNIIPSKQTNTKDYFRMAMSGKLHNSVCGCVSRRSIYIENEIYWVKGLNMLEDKSVTPRLLYFADSIGVLEMYLYHYNQKNDNSYTHKWNKHHFENIFAVVKLLDEFVKTQAEKEVYYADVLRMKLSLKSYMLKNCSYKDCVKLASLYPEANIMIRSSAPQFLDKICLYLASLGLYRISALYIFTLKYVKESFRWIMNFRTL